MNWRAKLQEQRNAIFPKAPDDSLTQLTQPQTARFDSPTKLTKRSFVGFVGEPSDHSTNTVAASRNAPALKAERARLLALATAECIDAAHVHRLHDADIAVCLDLSDGQRVAYLSMLADSADRHAGNVPKADTAMMACQGCGPVYVHQGIVGVLPVVAGWPRALGCPWCFVRKVGGFIPRPPVACGDCRYFNRDRINPSAGMGTCTRGKGMHYPMESHLCATFQPEMETTP